MSFKDVDNKAVDTLVLLVPLDLGVPADQAQRILLGDDGDGVQRDECLRTRGQRQQERTTLKMHTLTTLLPMW